MRPASPLHGWYTLRIGQRPSSSRAARLYEVIDRLSRHGIPYAACVLCLLMLLTIPGWSKDKPTRFWNLTGDTVTHLSLAPAGTEAYGPDQCTNDRDGTVDFDERLPITGVAPGRYDVRLDLKKGARCHVRNVEVQAGEVFSVEAQDLVECAP